MRIGIDAKWYHRGPPSGRVVVRNLVAQFALLDRGPHEMVLFGCNDGDVRDPFPGGAGIESVTVWSANNLLSNVVALPYHARRLGVDVLFCQNFLPPVSSARTIAHIHDAIFLTHPEYFTFRERLYLAPLKVLANTGDGFITGAQSEADRLRGLGFKQPSHVVPLACSEQFRPRAAFTARELQETKTRFNLPETFILYVGRLNIRKNIVTLLKALPLMTSDCPLVIVGDESGNAGKTGELADLMARVGSRITMLPGVKTAELPGIYALSTVFCFPSLDEGFGLPPLEAMASGVPVVVSRVASIPEVCGDAGVYVDPLNATDLALALDRAVADSEFRERKIELGFTRAREFSWRKTAAMIWDILRQGE